MISWFCLIEYMQQNREHSGLPTVSSREPGAHDVGDPLGDLAVARPQDRVERAGRGEQPVHLHPGDHVLERAEPVLRLEVGGEQLEAGRHDHRPHLDVHDLVAGTQVDAVLDRAGVDALAAFRADAAVEAQAGAVARLGLGHRQLDLAEVGRGEAEDLARCRRQRQPVRRLPSQHRRLVDDREAKVEPVERPVLDPAVDHERGALALAGRPGDVGRRRRPRPRPRTAMARRSGGSARRRRSTRSRSSGPGRRRLRCLAPCRSRR